MAGSILAYPMDKKRGWNLPTNYLQKRLQYISFIFSNSSLDAQESSPPERKPQTGVPFGPIHTISESLSLDNLAWSLIPNIRKTANRTSINICVAFSHSSFCGAVAG